MASTFKGIYRAYDFAYGVNPDAGGALQVISGSTSTGAYTITCSPVQGESTDGKPCVISTSTPITIGGDSGIETVTPSAVSVNGLNQVLITATFTYAHGTGAQVRSGSLGLAEAGAYAATKGGGVIAIDAGWAAAGGTQAMVQSVTQPAYVGLNDLRGEGTACTFTYTLTSAQILALESTPVQLLPKCDANSFYYITQAVLVNIYNSATYAGSPGTLTIGWGTTTATTDALANAVPAAFITASATTIEVVAGATVTDQAATSYLGQGIWAVVATNNPTTGNGVFQITLQYLKIST